MVIRQKVCMDNIVRLLFQFHLIISCFISRQPVSQRKRWKNTRCLHFIFHLFPTLSYDIQIFKLLITKKIFIILINPRGFFMRSPQQLLNTSHTFFLTLNYPQSNITYFVFWKTISKHISLYLIHMIVTLEKTCLSDKKVTLYI